MQNRKKSTSSSVTSVSLVACCPVGLRGATCEWQLRITSDVFAATAGLCMGAFKSLGVGGRESAALKPCRIGMVKAVFALCGSRNSTRVIEMLSTLMRSSLMGSFAFTILSQVLQTFKRPNFRDVLVIFEDCRPHHAHTLTSCQEHVLCERELLFKHNQW